MPASTVGARRHKWSASSCPKYMRRPYRKLRSGDNGRNCSSPKRPQRSDLRTLLGLAGLFTDRAWCGQLKASMAGLLALLVRVTAPVVSILAPNGRNGWGCPFNLGGARRSKVWRSAIVPPADAPAERLEKLANAAWYEAKRSGRNRVMGRKPDCLGVQISTNGKSKRWRAIKANGPEGFCRCPLDRQGVTTSACFGTMKPPAASKARH
ncbi:MAG: hypothetical protein JWR07_1341, partial [Nevskia sp.]|nr:hypothetical protein [Nevskia sp.]